MLLRQRRYFKKKHKPHKRNINGFGSIKIAKVYIVKTMHPDLIKIFCNNSMLFRRRITNKKLAEKNHLDLQ